MKLLDFIKNEFKTFGKYEIILFPLVLALTIIISILIKDNKIALISALCGMTYTILAGKGKVSCYFIGMIGTFCYSYLSLINGFFGNLALYLLYYFPMEIIGIYKWKKHLKKESQEIIKTKLTLKERYIYILITILGSSLLTVCLFFMGDKNPIIDAITTFMSIIGQLLTVKRCIEQWYVWLIVNVLSLIMWIIAYINGSNCLATIIMWAVYVVLAIYFLQSWRKELKD